VGGVKTWPRAALPFLLLCRRRGLVGLRRVFKTLRCEAEDGCGAQRLVAYLARGGECGFEITRAQLAEDVFKTHAEKSSRSCALRAKLFGTL
jgi:hypothetical protein